ncbi:MAG: translation initiation factor IF-3 [Pseudomonadota bacterium]
MEDPIARPPYDRNRGPKKDTGPRLNGDISAPKVRLVDADGEMRGVVALQEAINLAEESGLDLVEVSPNADPPVCKIIDYGKFRYEQQKKANAARKKQKVIELKEIKMRPMIDTHDYDVKMRAANKFLDNGDKVKFTMRYRGREMAHQELGMQVLNRVREDLAEKTKVELRPKMEGRQMTMILAPDTE